MSAHTTTRVVGVAIYIYIYIYINSKAINNVLHAKMVLKTHLFIEIFRILYRTSVFIMYLCIYFYIWLLKYKRSKTTVSAISHSLLHLDAQALTSHIGKILLSI